jgi:hypothetical protein
VGHLFDLGVHAVCHCAAFEFHHFEIARYLARDEPDTLRVLEPSLKLVCCGEFVLVFFPLANAWALGAVCHDWHNRATSSREPQRCSEDIK